MPPIRATSIPLTASLLAFGAIAMALAVPVWGEGLDPALPAELQLAGAIDSPSVVAVRRMLDAGADPNAPYEGMTPLVRTILRGKSYAARVLCEYGADIGLCDEQGWPPLFWAAAKGELQIARLLIEHKADVNATEPNYGLSVLQIAAGHGHTKVVELLIEKGARVAHRDRWQGNAVDEAAFAGHADIVKLLTQRGLAIEWPLHVAAGLGDRERVEKLLAEGADVNATTRGWENSPLAYAVGGGHLEIAQLLVERGAKVDARNATGATPMHIAAGHGRVKIATWLLEHDSSLRTAVDREGLTPLDWSHTGAIRQLLEPQGTASDQRTPLESLERRSGSSG